MKRNHRIFLEHIPGMRDKLIHGYFMVDIEFTWAVVKKDLPALKEQISNILEQTTDA